MFWKRLNDLTRTLSFRLNLWHAGIFLGSTALLFSLLYFLLSAAIDRKDRDVIEARLREYLAVYQNGGIPALTGWTRRVNEARKERMFFVRVVGADRAVLLQVIPDDWTERDLRFLDQRTELWSEDWIRAERDGETDLTVASARLEDGTTFQLGRSSDSRAALLGKFRQVFAMVIPPALLLGFIGGAVLTRRLIEPVRDVVDTASAIINTGRMDVRVPERAANDELQHMVSLFNQMLECNEELFRALRDSLDNV
ncbi:MAG TPA: HAMP domain-containing protein, partial [Chthoniobacterales bacterium]|nr:HAMP domain-containing protein [Chthoniobacterales bacterium]